MANLHRKTSVAALASALPADGQAVQLLPAGVFRAGDGSGRPADAPHWRLDGAAAARLIDGPSREDARHFLHVLLRVAAVHAERVQLHQLAAGSGFACLFSDSDEYETALIAERRAQGRYQRPRSRWPVAMLLGVMLMVVGAVLLLS